MASERFHWFGLRGATVAHCYIIGTDGLAVCGRMLPKQAREVWSAPHRRLCQRCTRLILNASRSIADHGRMPRSG